VISVLAVLRVRKALPRPEPTPAPDAVTDVIAEESLTIPKATVHDEPGSLPETVFFVLAHLSSCNTRDDILENIRLANNHIAYDSLQRDPGRYVYERWVCRGKILQLSENEGHTSALISRQDRPRELVWVEGDFKTTVAENSYVGVIGHLAGVHNYESANGKTVAIPALAARTMVTPEQLSEMKLEAFRHRQLSSEAPQSDTTEPVRTEDWGVVLYKRYYISGSSIQKYAQQRGIDTRTWISSDDAELSDGLANGTGEWPIPSSRAESVDIRQAAVLLIVLLVAIFFPRVYLTRLVAHRRRVATPPDDGSSSLG
jgi:hypothetical protein